MAKKPARPRDPNQIAKLILDITTGEVPNDSPKGPGLAGNPGSPQERISCSMWERVDGYSSLLSTRTVDGEPSRCKNQTPGILSPRTL